MKRYGIINENIDNLVAALNEPGCCCDYKYVCESFSMTEICHWLDDNSCSDSDYCIEEYDANEEGELLQESNFDTPSNFIRRRFLELRRRSGLTQAEFAQKYRIPKRSIENWEATSNTAYRRAPGYVVDLLERAVNEDFGL